MVEAHMGDRIVYRGVVYARSGTRRYFNPNGRLLALGWPALHRQIWLDAGRAIPPGHHIHHRDGDVTNNTLANLECLSASDHQRQHYPERHDFRAGTDQWRQSAAGKAILRDNAHKMQARTPERTFPCRHCGAVVVTRHPRQCYCSRVCKQHGTARAAQCVICGAAFRTHDEHGVTCSYRCGWAYRRLRTTK
jgi:hypothetical protein